MKLPAALLLAFLAVSSHAKPTDQLEKKTELKQEPLVTSQPALVHSATTAGAQMYGDEPAKPDAETAAHKAAVNEEILHKFGDFKDNCFPKPSGGCKCNEKDTHGNDIVAKYNSDADCKLPALTQTLEGLPIVKRSTTEEQARANYNKVVQELKDKFKGLKEGCYPRPKGCLCVIGKTSDGRDVTERRMKEADCKCREGQTGNGCPSGA